MNSIFLDIYYLCIISLWCRTTDRTHPVPPRSAATCRVTWVGHLSSSSCQVIRNTCAHTSTVQPASNGPTPAWSLDKQKSFVRISRINKMIYLFYSRGLYQNTPISNLPLFDVEARGTCCIMMIIPGQVRVRRLLPLWWHWLSCRQPADRASSPASNTNTAVTPRLGSVMQQQPTVSLQCNLLVDNLTF